jgi:hypothetical protein
MQHGLVDGLVIDDRPRITSFGLTEFKSPVTMRETLVLKTIEFGKFRSSPVQLVPDAGASAATDQAIVRGTSA